MRIKSLSILIGACFFFSCSNESEVPVLQQEKEKITTTFRLTIPPSSQITSRVVSSSDKSESGLRLIYNEPVETKATELDDEKEFEITDLWVLQYDEYSKMMVSQTYVTALNKTINGTTVQYEINADLVDCDLPVIYFVANLNDPNAFKTWPSLDVYLSMRHYFNDEESVTEGNRLIMTGSCWGLPSKGDKIRLQRLVSKLALTVNYSNLSESFSIESAQLVSVPAFGQYSDEGSWDYNWIFPEREYNNYIDYPLHTSTNGITSGTRLVWYMPENRQGRYSGSYVLQQQKTASHDPSYIAVGTSLATRIILNGTYNGKKTIITLYPGRDVYTDYNIIRDCSYEMTATITKLASNDERIKIYYPLKVEYYVWDNNDEIFNIAQIDMFNDFGPVGTSIDPDIFNYKFNSPQYQYKEIEFANGGIISSNEDDNVVRLYFVPQNVSN